MTFQNCLNTFHFLSFAGALIVIISSIGIWYYSNKIDQQKDNKINELIAGKDTLLAQSNAYLADLRSKETEINLLKSSVNNMSPELTLLEVLQDNADSHHLKLTMGASYPIDLRVINAQIKFTSDILDAKRYVVGSGTVQCNINEPIIKKDMVLLSGGPLNSSNYLILEIKTKDPIKIKSHNLKVIR